ncbi:MAG: hypothetical protein JWM57_709 [Phycisphaerales bacterium]|nr:hypothetical protein [Phycisphaerales bacterium]
MAGPARVICDRCGGVIPQHAHYVVKIDVYADPSMPDVSLDDLEETDFDATMARLLEEMKGATAEELEDAVAKRFEFRICRSCQLRLIRDPLGRGRGGGGGAN